MYPKLGVEYICIFKQVQIYHGTHISHNKLDYAVATKISNLSDLKQQNLFFIQATCPQGSAEARVPLCPHS